MNNKKLRTLEEKIEYLKKNFWAWFHPDITKDDLKIIKNIKESSLSPN
jgi:hypothetical protein